MKRRQNQPIGRSMSQTLTRAATHILLEAVNAGKCAALNDLARVYLPLCQQYVTLFCTEEVPDKFRATCFVAPLSERWHRVAI
ncbi:MAG TPA: transposase, partial [Ktedonobacteraceae bacterium]|nr:transposase [Ktedonobacteraceae bacterium]